MDKSSVVKREIVVFLFIYYILYRRRKIIGKGHDKRPPQISYEEEQLRWLLFEKKITFKQFERRYKQLEKEGKVYRKPRYKLNKATSD